MATINKRPQLYVAVGSYLPNKISYLISSLETFESIDIKDDNGVTLFSKKQRIVSGLSDFEISSQLRSFVENKPFAFVGTIEDKRATQKFYITGAGIDDISNIRFAVAASLDGYEQSLLPFVANQNNLTKFLQVLPEIKSYDISGAWLSILSNANYVQFVSTAYNHVNELIQTATRNQELARGGMARIYLPYVIGAKYGEVFINEIVETTGTNLAGNSFAIHTQYDNRTGIETSLSSSAVPSKTTFEGLNVIRINSILPEFESQKPYWNILFEQGKTYAISLTAFGLANTNLVDSLPISIDIWADVTDREKILSFESLVYNSNITFPNTQIEKIFLYTHTSANDTKRFGVGVKNELELDSVIDNSLVFFNATDEIIKLAIPETATATVSRGTSPVSFLNSIKNFYFFAQVGFIFKIPKVGAASQFLGTGESSLKFTVDRISNLVAYLSGANQIQFRSANDLTQVVGFLPSPSANVNITNFLVNFTSQRVLWLNTANELRINNALIAENCPAFTVDWAKNIAYYVYIDGGVDILQSTNLASLVKTDIEPTFVATSKLDIDVINQKLYYLSSNAISSINVDGTSDTPLQSDTNISDFSFIQFEKSNVNLDLIIQSLQVIEVDIRNQSSEVQRIDYERTRCNSTQLVWANNIGGWDTFVFDGYRTENFEIEETSVFTDFTQRTETNVIRGGRDRHTLSAGPVNGEISEKLKSCYTSKYVYKVEKNVFTPVVIATNTFSILNTKDQLFEVSFDILLPRNNL